MGLKPFIDTNYFAFAYGNTSSGERIIDSQWATSTTYVGASSAFGNLVFGVNFADGRVKGYPTGSSGSSGQQLPSRPGAPAGGMAAGGGTLMYFVRHVRGDADYGENDFVKSGDRMITDLATGLIWSQDDSGFGMNWEDALAYVQGLNDQNYLGHSDWRLPNTKELQSIVDYSRSPGTTDSAAIDPVFNTTPITNEDGALDWGYYWTSTTHASMRGGQAAVYVAFGRGLGYMNGQWSDVHGAGCQRSDPKSGSAGQYPTGHGPQGDAVRIDNFVRVVRG